MATARLQPGVACAPAPEIPTHDPCPRGRGGADYKEGGPVYGCGERGSLLQERGPSTECAGRSGARAAAAKPRALARPSLGRGPPAPPPAGSRGQGAARAATDPGSTSSLAPRCPDGGKGPRGRAGAGPDTPPPAGALHLAAAGERLPWPCPARRWPLGPPPPPLPGGGRAQAASDPSCRSSLLFFPLPVWHGHH